MKAEYFWGWIIFQNLAGNEMPAFQHGSMRKGPDFNPLWGRHILRVACKLGPQMQCEALLMKREIYTAESMVMAQLHLHWPHQRVNEHARARAEPSSPWTRTRRKMQKRLLSCSLVEHTGLRLHKTEKLPRWQSIAKSFQFSHGKLKQKEDSRGQTNSGYGFNWLL